MNSLGEFDEHLMGEGDDSKPPSHLESKNIDGEWWVFFYEDKRLQNNETIEVEYPIYWKYYEKYFHGKKDVEELEFINWYDTPDGQELKEPYHCHSEKGFPESPTDTLCPHESQMSIFIQRFKEHLDSQEQLEETENSKPSGYQSKKIHGEWWIKLFEEKQNSNGNKYYPERFILWRYYQKYFHDLDITHFEFKNWCEEEGNMARL